MICRNPYVAGTALYGCGQCMPCRVNRRRIWTHRMMLEASLRKDNSFVTLTYSPEEMPQGGTLMRKDMTDWLKRLRDAIYPHRVRYFGVGEYGDQSERPHYHLALFGYPGCLYGVSSFNKRSECCGPCDVIHRTWGKGIVQNAEFNQKTAMYIAGYCIKKMTNKDDARLRGRYREFASMSLRPGIGADVIPEVGKALKKYDIVLADVPSALRHGSKEYPLGRYLMKRLRKEMGRDEKAPQSVMDKIALELRPMFEAAKASSEEPSAKAWVVKAGIQQRLNMEARRKIYEKRKVIL